MNKVVIIYFLMLSFLLSDIILIKNNESDKNDKFEDITFIGTSKMELILKRRVDSVDLSIMLLIVKM